MDSGVPAASVAFYARWWQLEAWLRLLIYTELRAKYGVEWLNQLAQKAPSRAAKDEINKYMATPDASNVLAYLDFPDLIDLIGTDEHWTLFEPSLLPRKRWDGLTDQLHELRNRNAHCRRPHADDLNRVEQALRDLDMGARVALEAHNHQGAFTPGMADPIARGWIEKEHEAASRLIEHCEEQYDTCLRLQWSVRPWAKTPRASELDEYVFAGAEGVFIHANFILRSSRLELRRFWHDHFSRRTKLNKRLVFLVMDAEWSPSFTFSAVDGAEAVNDAIGWAFDAVIVSQYRGLIPMDKLDEAYDQLRNTARGLDARIHVDTPLALAYRDQPFSVFSA